MSEKPKPTQATKLPIGKALVAFVILLIAVSFTAGVFGENQKATVTVRHFMQRVASRDYSKAYELLTDEAKSRMDPGKFDQLMSQFRLYLTAQYGSTFTIEYKYLTKKKFWKPWLDDNVVVASVGLYRIESGVRAELREYMELNAPVGPLMDNMLTLKREKGRWLIDGINFDPNKYSDVIKRFLAEHKQILIRNDNGFVVEGFIYDRTNITPEERTTLIDQLTEAVDTLKRDAGTTESSEDDIFKIIP